MRSHSWLSKKCKIETSGLGGKGVFALKSIKKNELIAIWGGIVLTGKEVTKLSKKDKKYSTHTVSVGDGFYLGPIDSNILDDTEVFNHSCNPNIGVKGQIVLVARKFIKKGEELCFDYDTTETSDEGWFFCKCGSINCRKTINGSAWRNKNFAKKNWEYLSWYIKEKIRHG